MTNYQLANKQNKHTYLKTSPRSLSLDSRHRCPKVRGGRRGLHGIRHDVGGRGGGRCPWRTRWRCSACRPPTPRSGAGRRGQTRDVAGASIAVQWTAKWIPFPCRQWRHHPSMTQCWRATWKCAVPKHTSRVAAKVERAQRPDADAPGTGLRGTPGRGHQVQAPPCSLSRRQVPLFSPCRRIWHRTRRRRTHSRVMCACDAPENKGWSLAQPS